MNSEAWSVGKYAKRSHTIHINSDAQVEATEVMALNLINAVSANGLTITLTNASPVGGIAGMFLKVTSNTGVEWREIATNAGQSNDVTVLTAFTNMANGALNNARYEVFDRGFPAGQSNVDFFVDIPNYIGYPEHKRCLVQLQNVTVMPKTTLDGGNDMTVDTQTRPLLCGLELEGVPVHNSYTNTIGFDPLHFVSGNINTSQLVCVFPLQKFNATRHYTSNRSITDDGVLIGTPFGKRLRVKIKNMTTNEPLVVQPKNNNGDANDEVKNNPVHVTLRLLFLDDDEIPDR